MSFDWTDERVDRLRKFVAAKMSGGEIAAIFGCGLTRNAVVGKVMRLKLNLISRPAPKHAPRQPLKPVAKPAVRRSAGWSSATSIEPEAPKVIPPAPGSRPVDLMGLTNRTCRWPINDGGPFMFCGALEADNPGQPYCPFHTAAGRNRQYRVPVAEHSRGA